MSSHRGRFTNYISFIIHGYRSVSGLDQKEYQIHMRHLLIDSDSGHRSKETPLSTGIGI